MTRRSRRAQRDSITREGEGEDTSTAGQDVDIATSRIEGSPEAAPVVEETSSVAEDAKSSLAVLESPVARSELDSCTPPSRDVWAPRSDPTAEALRLAEDHQPREAEAMLQPILREDPEDLAALSAMARVLCDLGRFPDAQACVDKAIAINDQDVGVQYAHGLTLFRRGLYDQAEAPLAMVCGLDGRHADAHYYLGESLNRTGRSEQAAEILERASELNPKNARAFRTLGHLYDRSGRADRASVMFRKARELTIGQPVSD